MNRNELYRSIARKSGSSSNVDAMGVDQLLMDICRCYDIDINNHTMGNYLRAMDCTFNGEFKPIITDNYHLKRIAEYFSGLSLADGLSRNAYLEVWERSI